MDTLEITKGTPVGRIAAGACLATRVFARHGILDAMIRARTGATAGGPVEVMRHEHDDAGNLLRRPRPVTNDRTAPTEACNAWRASWPALADLVRSLHEHIHLENNVLFLRPLGVA